jgi:lipopolysaccharide transport system ATP-binding protein
MEFDVLEPGWPLSASYDFFNEEGLLLFGSLETDPTWRGKPKPPGRYATTAWVPGNLFTEGTVIVNAELLTTHPLTRHFGERQAVAFHVVDSMDGDSARGDWGGEWKGAVRPLLEWATRCETAEAAQQAARVQGRRDAR